MTRELLLARRDPSTVRFLRTRPDRPTTARRQRTLWSVGDGVPIPFASLRLLWRMKTVTGREKDAGDLVFLRYWFAERGEEPPGV